MPPTDRFVTCFAAEPPQEGLPYGRWADRLRVEFLAACLRIEDEGEDLGEAGEITWYPDRTWNGRTYVPATAMTTTGFELYGHVSYTPPSVEGEAPDDLDAEADFTAELAQDHPEWQIDLCEAVIGAWRGEIGKSAAMTLVWGRPTVDKGETVTAELADLVVDQCTLLDGRFTLIAPDDYRGDTLDVLLWSRRKLQLAKESLYEEEDAGE